MSRIISHRHVHKLILDDDHLFVIFNNSQIVVHFDQNNRILNQFRIDHPRFYKDYKSRLLEAKTRGRWVNCFGSVFIDNNKYINLCYFNNDLKIPEIYRYQYNGKFVDALRIRDSTVRSNQIINACDNLGHYFGVEKESSQISIYSMDKN